MPTRREKNITDTSTALRRALDVREVLLAKLVRNETKIRDLIKRNNRARKAATTTAKLDCSVAAGVAPSPFRPDGETAVGKLDDPIGF